MIGLIVYLMIGAGLLYGIAKYEKSSACVQDLLLTMLLWPLVLCIWAGTTIHESDIMNKEIIKGKYEEESDEK